MSADVSHKLRVRERLLDAAALLFYNDGIAATGIDAITARAGVAKQSLYNNFASKAALVSAYVEVRHAEWLALYEARLALANTPTERVLAVFDAYQDHAEHDYIRGFRGCGLLNAAAELTTDDPARLAVKAHKEAVEALLSGHLSAVFPDDAAQVAHTARMLAFLLEGAITRAGLEGTGACVAQAREMAIALLVAR
jgi:AcrR family transcriptional regulator